MINNSAIGDDWDDVRKELFTPEEIAESDLRVAVISALIDAREEQGISQMQLQEMSGVAQPVIARMEKGTTNPRLETVLKVLAPLGKTLAVVPLKATDDPFYSDSNINYLEKKIQNIKEGKAHFTEHELIDVE